MDLHHFLEEDHEKVNDHLHCLGHLWTEAITSADKKDFERAIKFNRDATILLDALVRLNEEMKKKEKIQFLLKQEEGQQQINQWMESYSR